DHARRRSLREPTPAKKCQRVCIGMMSRRSRKLCAIKGTIAATSMACSVYAGAGIRAYQKAESLPVTGQLDTQTADRLGVRPEDREETGYETAKGKPSAYMNRAKGLGRTSKTPRKPVKAVAAAESGLEDRQKSLQAENDNHPQ
ncbi:MAG TPA: hypothetical protein VFV92_08840, partial [Candidatus Bathyarchaeia archaeon]|nr:hypothetical protein [Candidatus Bathyarchaeia archaeon]